jgi:hypothetical protein
MEFYKILVDARNVSGATLPTIHRKHREGPGGMV